MHTIEYYVYIFEKFDLYPFRNLYELKLERNYIHVSHTTRTRYEIWYVNNKIVDCEFSQFYNDKKTLHNIVTETNFAKSKRIVALLVHRRRR